MHEIRKTFKMELEPEDVLISRWYQRGVGHKGRPVNFTAFLASNGKEEIRIFFGVPAAFIQARIDDMLFWMKTVPFR